MFAYIGLSIGLSHDEWPLIYLIEGAFVICAFVFILLARRPRRTGMRCKVMAFAGGISVSFGWIMPFGLASMFFGVRGEWMLATME